MRYRAEETERTSERIRYRIDIPASSPLLLGHFPGKPILPGVAQVQIVTELFARDNDSPLRWTTLESVRFRKPVLPDTECELELTPDDSAGRIAFRFADADGPIAEGAISWAIEGDADA